MAIPNTHWREFKLQAKKDSVWDKNFKSGALKRHTLFNDKGMGIAYVEPTSTGFWRASVGGPGHRTDLPGMFETVGEAKAACEGCFK